MNRIIRSLALPLISVVLLAGCENTPWNKGDAQSGRKMAAADKKKVAVANMKPSEAASTQPSWGKATGTVTFTDMGNGKVKVAVDLQGVPPGMHGFHIHEKGDLSAPDLSSAGAHYNPEGHPHAGPETAQRHAGDLGNVEADASGKVKKELTVENISIGGKNDILGKSVILHVKADDLKSQPSGDAGGRIAGGIIEMKKADKKK